MNPYIATCLVAGLTFVACANDEPQLTQGENIAHPGPGVADWHLTPDHDFGSGRIADVVWTPLTNGDPNQDEGYLFIPGDTCFVSFSSKWGTITDPPVGPAHYVGVTADDTSVRTDTPTVVLIENSRETFGVTVQPGPMRVIQSWTWSVTDTARHLIREVLGHCLDSVEPE